MLIQVLIKVLIPVYSKQLIVKDTTIIYIYRRSINVTIKINDNDKWVLKLCAYKTHYGKSGHILVNYHGIHWCHFHLHIYHTK